VTDSGEVWSCRRWGGIGDKWKKLKPDTDKWGRQRIALNINGTRKAIRVHTLIMMLFVGPRPEGMEVAHNNGDPSDNRLENLRYDTRVGNAADMVLHGTDLVGSKHGMANMTEPQVLAMRQQSANGFSDDDLASIYHVSTSHVEKIRNRRIWKCI
jgi:hypothetical protein